MKKNKIISLIATIAFLVFTSVILVIALRGTKGNPTEAVLSNPTWRDDGPTELSPERGRFALTYSIIESNSLSFSLPVARFATPDLGYYNGKFVSLFAPGLSYLIIPGYIIGKLFGFAQVGAYAVIALFALVNALLIKLVAKKLGASSVASYLAAIIFLFATPAFAYSVSLYQHHLSLLLILLSVYVLARWKNLASLLVVWFLAATSLLVDYPNLFLMFPIGLYALSRLIILKKNKKNYVLKLKLIGFMTLLIAFIPMGLFMLFNHQSYNNPLQLSGAVGRVEEITPDGKPIPAKTDINTFEKQNKRIASFFSPRSMVNGFYILLVSPDRGVIVYAPVMVLALLGIYYAAKKQLEMLVPLIGVITITFVLYTMWGDPWGGWAFGPRYLIPAFAIMAIFLAFALDSLRKNILFLIMFLLLTIYSTGVNTLGAITTNRNPPKIEILSIEKLSGRVEYYTYQRNWEFLVNSGSKSFIYQEYAYKYVDAETYYFMMVSIISIVTFGLTTILFIKKGD